MEAQVEGIPPAAPQCKLRLMASTTGYKELYFNLWERIADTIFGPMQNISMVV